jgi:hypothetical protein
MCLSEIEIGQLIILYQRATILRHFLVSYERSVCGFPIFDVYRQNYIYIIEKRHPYE